MPLGKCESKIGESSIKSLFKIAAAAAAAATLVTSAIAGDHDGKKVLFIDSYHEGYPWSDGITSSVESVIGSSGAELKIVRMDTKRNTSEDFKVTAADEVKGVIESWQPDVVIAADDNASKYLISKYYKDSDLPFVFCGVNWDASGYGFPFSNVTGMIEVASVGELIETVQASGATGERIALLTSDVATEHKEAANVKRVFGIEFAEEVYVKTFDEWKAAYKDLQTKADILFVSNLAGIEGWNDDEAAAVAEAESTIPSGTVNTFMARFAMITYAKLAEEQGRWSAQTALDILSGTSAADIEITQNVEGKMIINARIAEKIAADIPADLIDAADEIIE